MDEAGWTPHSWSREILLSDVVRGHSPQGVIEGPVAQHGDGDGENAIDNASESSSIALAAGPKPVVVLFGMRVAEDGNPCPVMQSVVEGQRASSSHEDLRSLLATLTAFFGDGSNSTEAPEGVEISEPNGV
ncbi:MAG: hypothetical protein ACRD1Z_02610, partial [Vicinamibacteria bacterium]